MSNCILCSDRTFYNRVPEGFCITYRWTEKYVTIIQNNDKENLKAWYIYTGLDRQHDNILICHNAVHNLQWSWLHKTGWYVVKYVNIWSSRKGTMYLPSDVLYFSPWALKNEPWKPFGKHKLIIIVVIVNRGFDFWTLKINCL